MNGTAMVYGNLALKPVEAGPMLTIVEGGKTTRGIADAVPAVRPQIAPIPQHHAAKRPSLIRAVVLSLATIVLIAGCTAFVLGVTSQRAASQEAALSAAAIETVTVHPGESLWGIAEAHPVKGLPTAEHVRAIREINGLSNGTLRTGMELEVPVTR